jgi:predicted ribonuclease YlaK
MQIFYDTCSLLNESRHAFEDYFFISNITLKELENIKTSASKDANIKFKARKLVHLLDENEDKYTIINYQKEWDEELKTNSVLPDTDDSRIILTAKNFSKDYDIIFTTKDLNCKQLAKAVGLNVKYLKDDLQDYTGYKEVIYNSDEELANIYQKLWSSENEFNLLANEYLIIKNNKNEIIDKYKYKKDGFVKIPFNCFESKMFGKIKPKDEYQALAMDSLKNNKITMIRGAAGTGKSMLAMTFLFSKLEKGDINKIIIFCNTVATADSAKLGFYPGTRTEKLLDSQIGNFLSSKIGDKFAVEKLIQDGLIELLPMSDIRGFDTTGLNAGVYITEAQNLDIELMRLALQRIGEDSICILEGDSDTQVDLPIYSGDNNGMRRVSQIFRGDDIYGEVTLVNIHRSHIAELAQKL